MSRFFGIDDANGQCSREKIYLHALAVELLDKKLPGIYNQAIMDFGAVICKPKNPLCEDCPLKNKCVARLQDKIDLLPVKTGKLIKKSRWFYYLVVEHDGKVYVRKRGPKDIWENLNEFVLLETEKSLHTEDLNETDFFKSIFNKTKIEIIDVSRLYRQQLTHQTIQGRFIKIKLKKAPLLKEYKAVTYKELTKLPFPKFITAYLTENELSPFER